VTRSSKGPAYCRLLMLLVRALRPRACLELGAAVGISAAYQAAALELNGEGRLVSVEGAPELARLAGANLDRLGLACAEVRAQSFERALAAPDDLSPVDFAFVDGDHTEEGTLASFRALRVSLSERGVIAFDDIRWSAGMRRAWSTISSREGTGTVADLGGIGIWSPAA
jgi:predicted O-methyltransferase YrrM